MLARSQGILQLGKGVACLPSKNWWRNRAFPLLHHARLVPSGWPLDAEGLAMNAAHKVTYVNCCEGKGLFYSVCFCSSRRLGLVQRFCATLGVMRASRVWKLNSSRFRCSTSRETPEHESVATQNQSSESRERPVPHYGRNSGRSFACPRLMIEVDVLSVRIVLRSVKEAPHLHRGFVVSVLQLL